MIMWDVESVAKSTGGVRLVGPEAGTRRERKSNTGATTVGAGKPGCNHRGSRQLLFTPLVNINIHGFGHNLVSFASS